MLVIDGDLYVYKAGFAHRGKEIGFKLINRESDKVVDLGNISLTKAKEYAGVNGYSSENWRLEHYNEPVPVEHVLHNIKLSMEKLMARFQNPEYRMFLTSADHSNYRYDIATINPYKGSRNKCVKCFERCSAKFGKDRYVILTCKYCGVVDKECTFADKPHYYHDIRNYLHEVYNAEFIRGQEADDAVSIIASERYSQGQTATMVHIDKDINNTPGWHYNPDKDQEYFVTEEGALRNFYTQFLLGDTIDCIPGVMGCGKVTAEELLRNCSTREEYEHTIFELFQGHNKKVKRFVNKMNLTPDEAYSRLTEIGQLLHIRQKENELWEPIIKF